MKNLVLTASVLLLALPGGAAEKKPLKESLGNFKVALEAARSSAAALDNILNPNRAALPDLNPALEETRQMLKVQLAEIEGIQGDFQRATDYLAKVGGYCTGENVTQVDKAREAMALSVARSRKWGSAVAKFGEEAGRKIKKGRARLGVGQQSQSARAKDLIRGLREKSKKITKALAPAAAQQELSKLHRIDSFCKAVKPRPAPPKDPRLGKGADKSKSGTIIGVEALPAVSKAEKMPLKSTPVKKSEGVPIKKGAEPVGKKAEPAKKHSPQPKTGDNPPI